MDTKNITCKIRSAHKISERKSINVNIANLVKRDYDNKNHNQIIHFIDVSYICSI